VYKGNIVEFKDYTYRLSLILEITKTILSLENWWIPVLRGQNSSLKCIFNTFGLFYTIMGRTIQIKYETFWHPLEIFLL
jgi:hypothetical protein